MFYWKNVYPVAEAPCNYHGIEGKERSIELFRLCRLGEIVAEAWSGGGGYLHMVGRTMWDNDAFYTQIKGTNSGKQYLVFFKLLMTIICHRYPQEMTAWCTPRPVQTPCPSWPCWRGSASLSSSSWWMVIKDLLAVCHCLFARGTCGFPGWDPHLQDQENYPKTDRRWSKRSEDRSRELDISSWGW